MNTGLCTGGGEVNIDLFTGGGEVNVDLCTGGGDVNVAWHVSADLQCGHAGY